MHIRTAFLRAAIVLIPSYTIAFLTEKMVYVVPMLAATSFFAAAVDFSPSNLRRRVDEDESDDDNDDNETALDIGIGDG